MTAMSRFLNYTLSLIFLLIFSMSGFTHTKLPLTFRDYRVVNNIDSLEKAVYALNNKPDAYLHGLITLERTRFFKADKVGQDLNTIQKLAQQQKSMLAIAMYNFFKARIVRRDDVAMSAKLAFLSLKYFESTKDTTGILNCYSHLIDLNTIDAVDKHKQNLLYYYDRITFLGQQSNFALDKLIRARIILMYAFDIFNEKVPEKGVVAFKEAIQLINNNPQYEYLRTGFYGNMAAVYNELHYDKEALALFIKLYKMGDNSKDIQNNYNLAEAYLAVGDNKNAEFYINKSLAIFHSVKSDNTIFMIKAYKALSEIQYKNKNYIAAWKSREVKDSLKLVNEKKLNAKSFLDLQTKYETNQKEQDNLTLQKEKKLLYLYLAFSFVLLILIIFFFLRLHSANKRIKALMKNRDQFYTMIAHDLRSPITTLANIGIVVNFLVKNNRTTELSAVTNQITSVSHNTQLLIDNMLEWGKNNNYALIIKPQLFDVVPIISELYNIQKTLAEAKGIDILLEIPDSLELFADSKNIKLIVRNMVDNAHKNTSLGKTIKIYSERTGSKTSIHVKDTGKGIPQQQLSYIQQVFAGKIKPELGEFGLGLGIILMNDFAKRNNAILSVSSELDKGSCFCLTFQDKIW